MVNRLVTKDEVLKKLRAAGDQRNREGMARFGIATETAFGVPVPKIRALAKEAGKDHRLAQDLWDSGIHEARILASMVESARMVTEAQMEAWAKGFDSWDVCDQCCSNLFDKTPFAYDKALEWSGREEEFVRRAGFVLMATLAVHDKKMSDPEFIRFLPVIARYSTDERNFVKKAVNWALRQIGKRNLALREEAIRAAEEIQRLDSKAARWVASDALRELRSDAVRSKLESRASRREKG